MIKVIPPLTALSAVSMLSPDVVSAESMLFIMSAPDAGLAGRIS